MICGSCGMPLLNPEDHAKGDETSEFCLHCVHPDGTQKNYVEILRGTVDHLVHSQGITREAATKMAKQLLDRLPYWHQKKKK